jgi:hypothetical protein
MITLFIAHTDTRHFSFEGVGATEDAAMAALILALKRHAKQYATDKQWLAEAIRIAKDEHRVRQITSGGAYRDHEKL